MLRGSGIIFTALLSVPLLGKQLLRHHYLGLAVSLFGVGLVGTADVIDEGVDSSMDTRATLIGMGLVFAGQVVEAAMLVSEEYLLKSIDLPPAQLLGLEGLWGVALLLLVVFPAMNLAPGPDNGHLDDVANELHLLSSSPVLVWMTTAQVAIAALGSAGSLAVTVHLSGMHRKILDAMRSGLIWAFGLGVHYLLDDSSPYGEELSRGSAAQFVGLAALVLGLLTYGGLWEAPAPGASPPGEDKEGRMEAALSEISTAPSMSSFDSPSDSLLGPASEPEERF
mmetsp:Transcript_114556/g.329120  ORF Transcript_114556/g.329120 Transcript_114556/m.329120 type:complete len:281 (+) Transcript_114556:268-1110(+)